MTTTNRKPDLAQALNVAAANVFVVDADLDIEFCNRQAMQTLTGMGPALAQAGVSANQVVGSPLQSLVGPDAAGLASAGDTGWTAQVQVGTELVRFQGNAMSDESGAFTGAIVTWEVVTDAVAKAVAANEHGKLVSAVSAQQAAPDARK